jgi:hypothetical protein
MELQCSQNQKFHTYPFNHAPARTEDMAAMSLANIDVKVPCVACHPRISAFAAVITHAVCWLRILMTDPCEGWGSDDWES